MVICGYYLINYNCKSYFGKDAASGYFVAEKSAA